MTNNKYFEVERITNGASGEKRTTKTFKDEEKAIAYAKRYHRTTKTIKSVKTTVYYFNGTDTGITYRANTKDGTEKDYRNGVTITKVIPERKYRFVPTESANVTAVTFGNTEEITVTFEGTDTEKQAIKFAEEMSAKNNRFYEIYEIVLGDKNKYIKTVKPKEQEQEKKLIGYRVGLGGTIYNTAEEAFRNNPKDEKQVFRIVEKDELTWSYEPIDKPIEKEVKTLQDWEKKGGNFTDFCKVGDKVDKGIVDYFADVLPPITWRTDLVQCGEPYGHRDNPETGRWEATFITFSKNDKGQWYYAGICFLNQREAIA